MTLRDYLLRNDLPGRRACHDALEWLDATAPATVADVVATCHRGEWLLWLAERVGVPLDVQVAAVRPAVLRAARVYAGNACEAAGLHEHAAALRALADDAAFETVHDVALAVVLSSRWATEAAAAAAEAATAAWAAWAAVWAAWAAWAAAEAACPEAAYEHALCADDVRAAIPDLAERVERAMEAA